MAELNLLPGTLDLNLYRGDNVSFSVTILVDGVQQTLPTTGWKAQVRTNEGGTLMGQFNVTVSGNVVTFTMSAENALAMDTGDKLVWDAQCEIAGVRTWLAGDIRFRGQVTT